MRNWLFIFFIAIVFASCKEKDPIIEKTKMEAVLWDVLNANSLTEQLARHDSSINGMKKALQLQQEIFRIHNITKEQFYKSYDYYASQPDMMKALLDSMTTKGDRERLNKIKQHAGVSDKKAE